MNPRHYIFFFFLISVLGCTNKYDKEWKAALNEDTFEHYFRFALDNQDFTSQSVLFDTLNSKVQSDDISVISLSQYSFFPINKDFTYSINVYNPKEDPGSVRSNNAFEICISKDGSILFEDSTCYLPTLKHCLDEFYNNPDKSDNLSSQEEITTELLGRVLLSKGMIGISGGYRDENTVFDIPWQKHIEIYGLINHYFNERRNELALEHFNMVYKNLDQKRKEAIIEISPLLIWFII